MHVITETFIYIVLGAATVLATAFGGAVYGAATFTLGCAVALIIDHFVGDRHD